MIQVCDFYMIHMYLWWDLHNMCDRLLILESKKQISFWHGSEQVNATHPPRKLLYKRKLRKRNVIYFMHICTLKKTFSSKIIKRQES